MAICEKCGNSYMQKECPYCKENNYEMKKLLECKSNKNTNKTVLIIIAICISIITLIILRNEYKKYKAEQFVKKIFFGTTNDNEIMKETNKMIEQSNRMLKQTNKQMQRAFKQINNFQK